MECLTRLRQSVIAQNAHTIFWCINQLPLSSDLHEDCWECYRILAGKLRTFDPIMRGAFLQSLTREFEQKTLAPEERIFLMNAVCDDVIVSRDHQYLNFVNDMGKLLPEARDLFLRRALALIPRKDAMSVRVAVIFLRSLLKGGLCPDESILPSIVGQPSVLRLVLKKLVLAFERHYPPEKADMLIASAIEPLRLDSKVIRAVLACSRPPAAQLAQIKALIRSDSIPPLSLLAILTESAAIVRRGLATVAELFQLLIRVGGTPVDNGGIIVRLFSDLTPEDLGSVPAEIIRAVVRSTFRADIISGFGLAAVVVEKAVYVADEVCRFMTDRAIAAYFRHWCSTFSQVLPDLPAPQRSELLTFLDELTLDELQYGHVSGSHGVKRIQTAAVQRRDPLVPGSQDIDARVKHGIPSSRSAPALMSPGFTHALSLPAVSGWRELSALLSLAPAVPRTLEILRLALECHPRALASVAASVLARFSAADAIAWIRPLVTGNHQQQLIAIEILTELSGRDITIFDAAIEAIGRMLHNEVELVKVRAVRAVEQ
jgi:hypothetical protein